MNTTKGLAAGIAVCMAFVSAPVAAVGQDADGWQVQPPQPVPATPPSAQDPAAQDQPAQGQPAPSGDAGSAWSAEIAPSGSAGGIELNDGQIAIVNKVSEYFKGLSTLKGRFIQTDAANKSMRGKFYVKRPGRFRFDYARPSRQIVISDGRYLAIQDLDLNNEDRVALNQTPFRLLLRSDVDLVRDARIMEVQESEDLIVVGLQDKDPDAPGQIRLFLSTKPELELKEWVTKDAQGLDTRVEVSSLDTTAEIDSSLFRIRSLGARIGTPR